MLSSAGVAASKNPGDGGRLIRASTPTLTSWFTDFSADTIGALPSGWTQRLAPATTTWQVADTSAIGGTGGKSLRLTGVTNAWRLLTRDAFDGATDVEIVMRFRYTDALGTRNACAVRSDAAFVNAYTSYPSNGNQQARKFVAAAITALGSSVSSVDNNEWWWTRLRVIGTNVKARHWLDGGAEPGTWHTDVTDTAHASGFVGLGCNAISGSLYFDVVGIAINGGTAPVAA